MSLSWHSFWFGALDPSGGVSVDKPPVDLWAQVASVKLFGWNATALKLPQALAGAASVVLVYDLVRRGFGRGAGLGAAAALAVLPVAVMTARSDTMDTLLAFLLLLAAWLIVRAIETGRIGWLLVAGATVGVAFNVKLFQALLPLPALAVLWAAGSPLRPSRTVLAGVAALAVGVVVAFAWIVPVALTPASQRPYPIGSTNGSIWNLVFVFNGIDRLHGRPVTTPDTLPAGSHVSAAIAKIQQQRSQHLSAALGATRLFGRHFGPRIGSELFPALLVLGAALLFAALLFARRRPPPPGSRVPRALALSVSVWLLTGVALFSAMRSFHPRYFETISPAVAMMLGGGLCVLVTRGARAGRVLAAIALAATAWYAGALGGASAHWQAIACATVALGVLALAWRPTIPLALAAGVALAAVLIVPATASWDVMHARAFDAERSGAMSASWPPLLDRYLGRHRAGTRYAFASVAPAKAAPLIAQDPQPVLMLTSYRSRPLISVPQLARLVRKGEVRYFLIGHRCTSKLTRGTAACPATARWAIAHSTDVTRATGLDHHGLLYRIRIS